MPTLRRLKPPKPPFAPPTPETSPTTTTARTAGAITAAFGFVAADIVLGGLLGCLASIPVPSFSTDEPGPPDITPLLAAISDTSAPVDDGEGNVQCTRCTYLVPYATMSLNEEGYFCGRCAAVLTREAGD